MRIITKAVLAVSMAVMCAGTAHAQEKGTDQKPDGLDPEAYFLSSLAPMFPLGNYHLQELTLYQEHLRRNTALRVRNFTL